MANDTVRAVFGMGLAAAVKKAGPILDALKRRPNELVAWGEAIDEEAWKSLPPFIEAEYHLWKGVKVLLQPDVKTPPKQQPQKKSTIKTWVKSLTED